MAVECDGEIVETQLAFDRCVVHEEESAKTIQNTPIAKVFRGVGYSGIDSSQGL